MKMNKSVRQPNLLFVHILRIQCEYSDSMHPLNVESEMI